MFKMRIITVQFRQGAGVLRIRLECKARRSRISRWFNSVLTVARGQTVKAQRKGWLQTRDLESGEGNENREMAGEWAGSSCPSTKVTYSLN